MVTSENWRTFADQLTRLVKYEGNKSFFDTAFDFLNQFVTVDSCAVFKVSIDKKSGAEHICTFGKLPTDLAEMLAEDYVRKGFKNDPMVQTALLSPKSRVRWLASSNYSDAYRSQFFDYPNLIDKVTSTHASRNTLFIVSFYRLRESGIFLNEEFKDLQRLAPIMGRSVFRHSKLTVEKFSGDPHTVETANTLLIQRITSIVYDNSQIFSLLSTRERAVAFHSLMGLEEKSIAEELGVLLGTIVTYRKRMYSKLGICSKAQLFQLVLMLDN